MVGRKEKVYMPLWQPIEVQNENRNRFSLGEIQICCPVCGTLEVGTYGTHGRKDTRLETF